MQWRDSDSPECRGRGGASACGRWEASHKAEDTVRFIVLYRGQPGPTEVAGLDGGWRPGDLGRRPGGNAAKRYKRWTSQGVGTKQAVGMGEQRSLRRTLGWLVTCLGHLGQTAEGPEDGGALLASVIIRTVDGRGGLSIQSLWARRPHHKGREGGGTGFTSQAPLITLPQDSTFPAHWHLETPAPLCVCEGGGGGSPWVQSLIEGCPGDPRPPKAFCEEAM